MRQVELKSCKRLTGAVQIAVLQGVADGKKLQMGRANGVNFNTL